MLIDKPAFNIVYGKAACLNKEIDACLTFFILFRSNNVRHVIHAVLSVG